MNIFIALKCVISEAIILCVDAISYVRARKRIFSYSCLAMVVFGFCFLPFDTTLSELIAKDQSRSLKKVARGFSEWGDFVGTLIVVAALVISSSFLRKRRAALSRLALACFLAASLAGLAVNVIRYTTGRPRPFANKPDGLYGPSMNYKLHGFPSAHSATAAATAIAVSIGLPVLAPALIPLALGVMWSRLHRRRHHILDVMTGAFIGALFAVPLSRSVHMKELSDE